MISKENKHEHEAEDDLEDFGNMSISLQPVPTYPIKGSKLEGKALFINNITFSGNNERYGAENDSSRLIDTFQSIGFKCDLFTDLVADDIRKIVTNFSKQDFLNTDVSLIVIMSHGYTVFDPVTERDNTLKSIPIREGSVQMYGTNNEGVFTDELIGIFTEGASKLQGKPKIFLFQCCR
ncbi:hypothetical protein GWI33_003461 [Rhynchophorus ferrugineus]|uniref:Caspase family p20 domain-containing protein n=1 Tax=Rhynchophorus ferrugineus TaxID=354439 RepID=A0A834HX86_RHYFE|nr:hypothetical protein GWI33_003461 [Rhynchophorus ferrugineus]